MSKKKNKIDSEFDTNLARPDNPIEKESLKATFLSHMSHEFRTPLNGIIGLSELLYSHPKADDEITSIVKTIHHSSKILLELLNNALELSKLDANTVKVQNRRNHLRRFLNSMRLLFEGEANQKGLDFFIEVDPSLPDQLIYDELILSKVLTHLLGNCFKFTNAGEVKIEVSQKTLKGNSDRIIQFVIQDSGIGIARGNLKNVMRDFSQEDQSSKKQYKGLGLGLAICRKSIAIVGGTISIDSILGKGTTVSFSLPMKDYSSEQVMKDSSLGDRPDISPSTFKNLKVLVVEDNSVNQLVIVEQLKKMGINADLAENGLEAIEANIYCYYDLILMDLHMPLMDGFEATKKFRSMFYNRETKIIALSANSYKDDQERCFKVGMEDFLAKPVDFSVLKNKLHEIVQRIEKKEVVEKLADERSSVSDLEPLSNQDFDEFLFSFRSLIKDIQLSLKKNDRDQFSIAVITIEHIVSQFFSDDIHASFWQDHAHQLEVLYNEGEKRWSDYQNFVQDQVSLLSASIKEKKAQGL
jgi:CheY-like chemotaxis protein